MKQSIEKLFITPQTTISEAMIHLNEASSLHLPVGIVLVIKNGTLIGTVTDGDIRKAIVKGKSLNTSVIEIMANDPVTVKDNLTVDEILASVKEQVQNKDRIRDVKVDKILVVNHENKPVDLFDFYDLWHRKEKTHESICIVGTGFVGLTLGVSFARAGYKVTGLDSDVGLVKQLNSGNSQFYEKGLNSLLKSLLKRKQIQFISKSKQIESDTRVFIICVGTPIDKTGKPDLSSLISATESIGDLLTVDSLVILRSTVPVGTTRNIVLPILERKSGLTAGINFFVSFAPERVIEGKALNETESIPQIIGGINKASSQATSKVFKTINNSLVVLDNLEEAEMIKLLNNSFRDLSFSFANSIAQLCEKLNLDTVKIINAANEGYPRNRIALPSPGVGGYCLTKDPLLLSSVAEKVNSDSRLFQIGRQTNESMHDFVVAKLVNFIQKNGLQNIKIYILGFAFKGNPPTSDTRGSSTFEVLKILRTTGFNIEVHGFDPYVPEKVFVNNNIIFSSYDNGFKDADMVLLMNNNEQFADVDIFSLLDSTKKPALFFDTWYMFNPHEVSQIDGIEYQGLGGGYSL